MFFVLCTSIWLKMSLGKVRWFLHFYNFFGILSLKIKNEKFEISNTVAISNLLKMPFVYTFSSFVLMYPPLMEQIYDFEFAPFKTFSIFASISMWITFSVMNMTCFIFCVVQFFKRHQIRKLANICVKIKLRNDFLEKAHKRSRNESWKIFSIFALLAISQYASTLRGSLVTMVCNLIISYPNMLMLAYASFLKSFEFFLSAHLDSFQCNLNEAIIKNSKKIESLLAQFDHIYEISEEFNSAFGASFNLYISAFLLLTIFNVSFTEIRDSWNIKIFKIYWKLIFRCQGFNSIQFARFFGSFAMRLITIFTIMLISFLTIIVCSCSENLNKKVENILQDHLHGNKLVRY